MGKWLSEGNAKKEGSLVQLAYEHDVPIFCPAFVDSSAGFGLVKHQVDAMKRGGHYMVLDAIADFRELTDIKIKAGTTGLLMIGGGVPKNFTQDTVVCAEILGHEDVEVHKYAVQITVADVRDGACSSSTLQEACSWGKVDRRRWSRWCSPKRPRPSAAGQRRLAPRRLEVTARKGASPSCSTKSIAWQNELKHPPLRDNPRGGFFMPYSPILAPVVALVAWTW
jgi:hypothetical protein